MANSTDRLVATLHEWFKVSMRRAKLELYLYAKEKQLSRSQFVALLLIQQMETCGVTDLAAPLDISPAAASQLVDRLVQHTLIERRENPQDRRAKVLTLTDKGQQLLDEGNRMHLHRLTTFANTLSPTEQAQITAALRLLLDRMDAFDTLEPI